MLKKLPLFIFIVVFFLITALAMEGIQDRRKSIASELEKVNDAIEVIEEMVEIPEEGIPEALLSNAYGIAIIPKVIKAAWVVGGRYGKGVILVRNERGRWGNPCFVRIAGGSVGWQIGVQSAEIYSYSKSRGLFAGVSVEGSAIQIDEDANANFYDQDYLSAHDILFGGKRLNVPAMAKKLKEILTEYTSTRI